jgi:hypothetical protein
MEKFVGRSLEPEKAKFARIHYQFTYNNIPRSVIVVADKYFNSPFDIILPKDVPFSDIPSDIRKVITNARKVIKENNGVETRFKEVKEKILYTLEVSGLPKESCAQVVKECYDMVVLKESAKRKIFGKTK